MTDYLELLLERRREEDEQDVLRLGAEEVGFSPPKRPEREEAELSPEGRGEDRRGLEPPMGALYVPKAAADRLTRRVDDAGGFAAYASALPEAAELGDAMRRKTGWTALDRMVERTADALGGGETGRSGPPPVPDGWTGGAAGLAGRLSQAALAAAAPARTVFEAVENAAPAGADWEEFDRRLERDARRYDGGLEIY